MGIYDRDYYREPTRGGFADFRVWSINTWLIIINVAVFLLDNILQRSLDIEYYPLRYYGYFSLTTAIVHLEVWRFITFQFLHESVSHLFFNMLGLYFFGPIVEGQLGGRRYLGFYLSCGIAGAVMYLLLLTSHVLITDPATPMIGASAGIFGVLIAAAIIAPDMQIMLWFPPMPLSLRVMAWIYVGIAVYTVLNSGMNAGGEAAHLGGAVWGFLLIRNQHWLNFLAPGSRRRSATKKRIAFRDWSRDMDH
jgi:membrane associated rhomboid family serine protease